MKTNEFVLAIDAGNSRTKFALLAIPSGKKSNRDRLAGLEVVQFAAFATGDAIPWAELRLWMQAPLAMTLVAGSNPPGVNQVLESWPLDIPAPQVIRSTPQAPISIEVDYPEKVGLDRLFNAVAANHLKAEGQPAIIVDSGTATTVDLVTPRGAFSGGAILPGIELSARALHEYTALLPLVPKEDLREVPLSPLGKNTRDAMRSGLLWGQLGAVKELIARLKNELQPHAASQPLLLVTGGGASLLAPYLPEARIEPALGLMGLWVTGHALKNRS